VTAALLDVNVLIALAWPAHIAHERAMRWFRRHAQRGWATCPLTELAFIRIISNPAFSPDALTLDEAMNLLAAILEDPVHHFWPDEVSLVTAVTSLKPRLHGHQQLTDAYLLGLVLRRKGRLATLDKTIASLLPEGSADRERVELI
jgi:toxin-antitoxin system PIN domain toxin